MYTNIQTLSGIALANNFLSNMFSDAHISLYARLLQRILYFSNECRKKSFALRFIHAYEFYLC